MKEVSASKWIREWVRSDGGDYGVHGLQSKHFGMLLRWGRGWSRDSRSRAQVFKNCIIEGRTLKASIAKASE